LRRIERVAFDVDDAGPATGVAPHRLSGSEQIGLGSGLMLIEGVNSMARSLGPRLASLEIAGCSTDRFGNRRQTAEDWVSRAQSEAYSVA
jgi:hypothetical protein